MKHIKYLIIENKGSKWTLPILKAAAKPYKTRSLFQVGNPPAYSAAYRQNLLDEIFDEHENKGIAKGKWDDWTVEDYKKLANNLTRGQFQNAHRKEYDSAVRRGLLEDIFKDHENKGKADKYVDWTFEDYKKEADKYDTRKEFKIADKNTFNAAERKGLINKLFQDKENQGKINHYYTDEEIEKMAKNYKTRNDFKAAHRTVYFTAAKRKILNKIFSEHENEGRLLKDFSNWTIEDYKKEAKKYKTRGEFQVKDKDTYNSALRKGIIDQIFDEHENKGIKFEHWTDDTVREEAKKYKTVGEFLRAKNGAYKYALRHHMLDEIFDGHEYKGRTTNPSGYWTFERIYDTAKNYKTRGEFGNSKDSAAYVTAIKNGIIEDVFADHTNKGYATIKELKDNQYTVYVFEFVDTNQAYIGLSNNMDRREREHLTKTKGNMYKFCKENNIDLPKYKVLEENISANEARLKEIYWADEYKINDWNVLNIKKAGSLGNYNRKWTPEALEEEAKKYPNIKEFRIHRDGAYQAAIQLGILDDIFKDHVNGGYIDTTIQTFDKLELLVKNLTRKEFREKYPNEYAAASRNKWIDDLFDKHINKGKDESKTKFLGWSFEDFKNIADNYKDKADFRRNKKDVFNAAKNRKYIDKIYPKKLKSFENFRYNF